MSTRQIDSEVHAPPRKKSHFGFLALLLIFGAALALGIVYELKQRRSEDRALAATRVEDAARPPVVNVGRVRSAPARSTVELPCQTVPLVETPIYARADGYIRQRAVDIGNRVKKDQLLIEIDSPELDQQIDQARASLAQSRAALEQLRAALAAAQSSLKLAEVTAERWKKLADQGVFARQDYDEKAAALDLARANVNAAQENIRASQSTIASNEANLKRLTELKSFDRLLAPFDGVITFRALSTDVGTLISSGNTASSRELLRVAQIDVLRVFVDVPQSYAPMIREGVPADLAVDELPGRVFHTKVDSLTHSVESDSRTMLAVLKVKNENEALLPGMYAKARFALPRGMNVVMLPSDALLLPPEGPRVVVVGEDRKAHFQDVKLGRDYGAEVEILSGLSAGQMVVLSPTDAVREGVTIEPRELSK